ncbi:hypothetical protein LC612_40575 [Nostoc sp. CHAB 5834]|nr:hypothetical protein [Nostoc sp. CHAB 5834]
MDNYKAFQDGLQKGLQSLWRTEFMSGLRNGGFEQTLRNVCTPYLEKATGRMAFTESRRRADLLLCDVKENTCTRCEFKVNFALQTSEIHRRKADALAQIEHDAGFRVQDGIVVYVIVELIYKASRPSELANLHNKHVGRDSYKRFLADDVSGKRMNTVRNYIETAGQRDPAFSDAIFPAQGICSRVWEDDGASIARLHAWTYHNRNS